MSDADKPEPPPPPLSTEEWSGISSGDLGFKAVYWTDANKTALVSRPILGWITFSNRLLQNAIPRHGFAAVVAGDNWLPALAGWVPNHHCIAPKDATDEEILAKFPPSKPFPQGGAPN
jgi:hypothetical protein